MVLPCEKRIVCGEDGHRSHCLVHAKHALYHLSYIPERVLVLNASTLKPKVEDRGIDPLTCRMQSGRSAI